jgi:hypothetical protein
MDPRKAYSQMQFRVAEWLNLAGFSRVAHDRESLLQRRKLMSMVGAVTPRAGGLGRRQAALVAVSIFQATRFLIARIMPL